MKLDQPMKLDQFSNQGTSIYFDSELQCIVATYAGFIKYEDWVAHLEYALELIVKHKVQKWISDTREGKVIPPTHQKYFLEVFTPQTQHKGVRYIATVVAKDAFNEFGTKQMMNNYQSEKGNTAANSQYFKTMEEATAWLQSKN